MGTQDRRRKDNGVWLAALGVAQLRNLSMTGWPNHYPATHMPVTPHVNTDQPFSGCSHPGGRNQPPIPPDVCAPRRATCLSLDPRAP
jgi:hypothetical protein